MVYGTDASAPRGVRVRCTQQARSILFELGLVEHSVRKEGRALPAIQANGVVGGETGGFFHRRHNARNREPHEEASKEREPGSMLYKAKNLSIHEHTSACEEL